MYSPFFWFVPLVLFFVCANGVWFAKVSQVVAGAHPQNTQTQIWETVISERFGYFLETSLILSLGL